MAEGKPALRSCPLASTSATACAHARTAHAQHTHSTRTTHAQHMHTNFFFNKMSCVTPELRVFSIHHPASQGERIAAIVSLMCILSHLSANCALQILENKAVGRMQISRFIAVLGGSHPGEINELPLGKHIPSLCRCRNIMVWWQ